MNPSSLGGFALGDAAKPATSTSNPAGQFAFAGITAQSTPIQNPPASMPAPTFGSFATPSLTPASTATTTAAAPATSGFSFLSSTPIAASTANPVSLAAPTTTTTSTGTGLFGTGTNLLSAAKTTKSVSFSFTSPSTTTTAAPSVKSILKSSAPVSTTASGVAPATSSVTSGSGDQVVNYIQLQDLTNKWISDFEDLQKLLLNQTAETINRDVILASNEDKIEKLVHSVENLKSEQTIVEQQLDFILSQQKDLEECLVSLEDEVSSYFPDLPADDMYKLAENIDSRLKRTLETSKEIITKINDKNHVSENVANPMVAIGRILNHLTNSIQMLENMNADGQTKLSDLQKVFQQYTS